MIPCTEFIPSYSELFSYIEEKYGENEVEKFWNYLFKPTGEGIPLINYLKEQGIRGCFSYWSGTLNEEAADFTLYLNEKAGWFALMMHRCPSKGRLLELSSKTGIVPYHKYCMHCDHYRESCESVGLKYIYNFIGVDKASCTILIYDPQKFNGKMIVDENTEIMDRRASDNEYFHKDFHSSLNMGVDYLGEKFGEKAVKDYLIRYTENVYREELNEITGRKLNGIKSFIEEQYSKEKAESVLTISVYNNILDVKIEKDPAIEHLKNTSRKVSKWYYLTTTVIMERIAQACNANFELIDYDVSSGKTHFKFSAL